MSLVLDSLSKRFGTVQALDGISFTVEPGEVFAFLGANGAGKTTTMRIVMEILRADSGTVTWRVGRSTSCRAGPGGTSRRTAGSTRG